MVDERLLTVVCFGDSTTAARPGVSKVYAQRLHQALARRNGRRGCVINAGVPGNTTRMAAARFDEDVLAHSPDVVVVQFGLNDQAVDLWRNPPASASRVSVGEYSEHLRHFVQAVRERGGCVVLMTPNAMVWTEILRNNYGGPPYEPGSPDGLNVLLRDYVEAVRQIAVQEGTPLVDVFACYQQQLAQGGGPGLEAWLLDGMHPNDAGHAVVAGQLIPVIDRILASNEPDSPPGQR